MDPNLSDDEPEEADLEHPKLEDIGGRLAEATNQQKKTVDKYVNDFLQKNPVVDIGNNIYHFNEIPDTYLTADIIGRFADYILKHVKSVKTFNAHYNNASI